jgi:hypothetical protein
LEVNALAIGNTAAKLEWIWDSIWLEEQGEMNYIQGELKGFKVSLIKLLSLYGVLNVIT